MKKLVGLSVATFACGAGLLALSSPAHALVSCAGNANFGTATTGSGANCGFLGVGQTFEIDVTPFFPGLNPNTQVGIGIVTGGGSTVSFSSLEAVVTGQASTGPITNAPIGIWAQNVTDMPMGLGAPNPFGTATLGSFTYTPSNFFAPGNAFRTIAFGFGATGLGGFGSLKASPAQIGLTRVDQFLIRGTLASVGNNQAENFISFAVGPGGIPTAGSTFGGFFSTNVPGPLPIPGAGAAFAWSRRLRRKQKLASGN